MKENVNIVNRKAKYEYEFMDSYQAGIVLKGVEVKLIRDGKLSFVDSYCIFQDGELLLKNISISGMDSDEVKQDRKLLLKKQELNKLLKSLDKGLTIIPYRIYNNKSLLKVEIKLARGKKIYDKRETIKSRDIQRELKKDIEKLK
tara:strand:+ start:563 stop:997 length:435 start_codon:yes stop_codon:yes gene_type:complete